MPPQFISRERLVGKQVVDSKAIVVGVVKDIAIGLEAEKPAIALTVSRQGQELTLLWTQVAAIGDVVLLKEPFELPAPPPQAPAPAPVMPPPPPPVMPATAPTPPPPPVAPGFKVCPRCGNQNRFNVRFCVKCGYAFPA